MLTQLRTRKCDHDVDLVLICDDGKDVAFEVKLAGTVDDRDTRDLHWLARLMGADLFDPRSSTPVRSPTGDRTVWALCPSGSPSRDPALDPAPSRILWT